MSLYHCYLCAEEEEEEEGGEREGDRLNEWLIQKADSSSHDSEMDMMFDRQTSYKDIRLRSLGGQIKFVTKTFVFKIN